MPELTLQKLIAWAKRTANNAREDATRQRATAPFASCLWDAAWYEDAARCLEEAAAEIERLTREVAVRDRALEAAEDTVSHYQDALTDAGSDGGWDGWPSPESVKADWLNKARAELAREQEEAPGAH